VCSSSLPNHISLRCPLSSFVIPSIGLKAHIGFACAVYTDGPCAEVLFITLLLCVPDTDMELRTLAACHLSALKKAFFSLSQCYNQTSSSSLCSHQAHDSHTNLPSQHFTLPRNATSRVFNPLLVIVIPYCFTNHAV